MCTLYALTYWSTVSEIPLNVIVMELQSLKTTFSVFRLSSVIAKSPPEIFPFAQVNTKSIASNSTWPYEGE